MPPGADARSAAGLGDRSVSNGRFLLHLCTSPLPHTTLSPGLRGLVARADVGQSEGRVSAAASGVIGATPRGSAGVLTRCAAQATRCRREKWSIGTWCRRATARQTRRTTCRAPPTTRRVFISISMGSSKFLFPHAASASADRALLRVLFPDSGGAGQAKYCLSVARKMGCSVFLLWQDVVRVPKIIT